MSVIAVPGTIVGLHAAIKDRLASIVQYRDLSTKDPADRKVPTVIDGWLPPKEGASAEQFPYLLVRPKSGNESPPGADQNATATFEIIIGCYSDTDDGFLDVIGLIDAIRYDFNDSPVLASNYEQIGPMTWELEIAARPQWLGSISTIWQIPRARREDPQDL